MQCLVAVLRSGRGLRHSVPPGIVNPAPAGCQVLRLPFGLANHSMSASPDLRTRKSFGHWGSFIGVARVPGIFTTKFSRCSRCVSISSGSHIESAWSHISSPVPFHGPAPRPWVRVRTLSYQVLPDCGSQRGLTMVADIPPTRRRPICSLCSLGDSHPHVG
jgi:hypothetical protein